MLVVYLISALAEIKFIILEKQSLSSVILNRAFLIVFAAIAYSIWMISNFEGARIHWSDQWNDQVHPIKKFVRNIAHRIIGMDRIEQHLNGILSIEIGRAHV